MFTQNNVLHAKLVSYSFACMCIVQQYMHQTVIIIEDMAYLQLTINLAFAFGSGLGKLSKCII